MKKYSCIIESLESNNFKVMILINTKIKQGRKSKKTAWELIEEIPKTPEQKRIDREIAAIERKYDKIKLKKQKKEILPININKMSKSLKNKKNESKVKIQLNSNFSLQDYGQNAGKIWNVLNINGPLNQSSIIQNTDLSLNDFFIGIGWLARENKISKEMKYYKLGDTNLTYEIGENAGKIWRLLDTLGQIDIDTISKKTEMKNEDIYSAIGWLSRENKIKFLCRDKQLIYELT